MESLHQVSIAYEGIDTRTPKDVKLSAKYMKSFAYYTVKDRLPVILTKVINELVIHKQKIVNQYGKAAEEDLKSVIGKVSRLKNEVVTNKSFIKLCSKGDDVEDWNEYLQFHIQEEGLPCWFLSPWLYVECYMYRRLWEIFENRLDPNVALMGLMFGNQFLKIWLNFSETLQNYDLFMKQKEDAFYMSLSNMKVVGQITLDFLVRIKSSKLNLKQQFKEFLKLSLWSNRSDLSLSNGAQIISENCNLSDINALDSFLLADDSEKFYEFLNSHQNAIIEFVNDNSAYEVFCDLCLCDVLCASFLASKIRFHVKKIPWYISDVMKKDISWLLDKLAEEDMQEISQRWKKYFQEGIWSISEEKYWTLPFDYNDMKTRNAALYESLKNSNLVIFKGDLNYRKLLGDINWDHCEKFDVCLREFKPANILSLRTVKADLICGLNPETCERFVEEDRMWMRTGDFGTIQFYQAT